jgi:hypothetical protein
MSLDERVSENPVSPENPPSGLPKSSARKGIPHKHSLMGNHSMGNIKGERKVRTAKTVLLQHVPVWKMTPRVLSCPRKT